MFLIYIMQFYISLYKGKFSSSKASSHPLITCPFSALSIRMIWNGIWLLFPHFLHFLLCRFVGSFMFRPGLHFYNFILNLVKEIVKYFPIWFANDDKSPLQWNSNYINHKIFSGHLSVIPALSTTLLIRDHTATFKCQWLIFKIKIFLTAFLKLRSSGFNVLIFIINWKWMTTKLV